MSLNLLQLANTRASRYNSYFELDCAEGEQLAHILLEFQIKTKQEAQYELPLPTKNTPNYLVLLLS